LSFLVNDGQQVIYVFTAYKFTTSKLTSSM